jgi:MraZ protein
MSQFIGEYECKIDGKGRLVIPAKLKKQLPPDAQEVLVINRGFDKCLTLFTKKEWDKETDKLEALNLFDRKDRQFIRVFNNGAQEISIDNSDRILLPKKLQEYAEIHNDVVLFAYSNRIEIWSSKVYEQELNLTPDEFASLAEQVMGKNKPHRPEGTI